MKRTQDKGGVGMTKRAMGNLLNRYRSVLKKCHLMNTFGSLAVASILVMGAASGEAFSNTTGYNAADPASSGTTVSATDQSENAVASAIKVDTAATYTVSDTVTRAEATAIGKQSARAFGVFVQGSAGNRLTLDSLDIETPPRVWGRPCKAQTAYADQRNTPTGVGKTRVCFRRALAVRKHPHGCGEDPKS